MTDISCHSFHSNNSLQDIFDSSLNRFLDEPGHLIALEMVLSDHDSTDWKGHCHLQSSNKPLPCPKTTLLNVSTSSLEQELGKSQELAINHVTETNRAEDMKEIEKLREMKLQLERDLKAKKERKKRRAQKKKRIVLETVMNEQEDSPEHDKSPYKGKDDTDPENVSKKVKEDEVKRRDKTKRDRDQKTSPRQISKKELRRETCLTQSPEGSRPIKSHAKRKDDEPVTLREMYTDTGSLRLDGYIQIEGNRRRHSSHERTIPFPEFINSDQMEMNNENDKGSKVPLRERSNPIQEKRRHSSCDISRKAPTRCTSCPIQEITIVREPNRDLSKMEVSFTKDDIKLKSKEEENNKIKDGKNNIKIKQAKKEKIKPETIPTATKIKEDTLTEAELNALKEWEAQAASAKLKEERLKKFEEERGSSTSPRMRSKKKPGLSNKPPPKCILDALNWATRNGLFGVNYDQTRRARMIAAHRRQKFEDLVGEYDNGVILRRHSVSS